jgi:hypothetical protein
VSELSYFTISPAPLFGTLLDYSSPLVLTGYVTVLFNMPDFLW